MISIVRLMRCRRSTSTSRLSEKNAVQRVARDLRERRMPVRLDALGLRCELAADAHYQHFLGAEVQSRADRRDLAHRAVAEILAVDVHRRKNERQRARCEHMLEPDRRRDSDAPRALPAFHARTSLIERDRLSRAVARARDAESGEVPGIDVALKGGEIEIALEQLLERRVVEQRNGLIVECAAGQHGPHPSRAVTEGSKRIRAVDVIDVNVLPHRHQAPHAEPEIVRVDRENRGVHGARGSAADNRERTCDVRRIELGQRAQHADLISRAGASARHDQACLMLRWPVVLVHAPAPAGPLPAFPRFPGLLC